MAVNAVSRPVRDDRYSRTLGFRRLTKSRHVICCFNVYVRGPVSIDKHGHGRDIIVSVLYCYIGNRRNRLSANSRRLAHGSKLLEFHIAVTEQVSL